MESTLHMLEGIVAQLYCFVVVLMIIWLGVRCRNKFQEHWKKVAGMGIYQIISWAYDNPLWMSVEMIWKVEGVVALMIGAMVMNFSVLLYYKRRRVPWLCLDEGVACVRKSWVGRKFLRSSSTGRNVEDIMAFFLLSIFQDSFITTAYLRHGESNGLKLRDGYIFLASSIVSISYWAVRNGLIVETVRSVFKVL